MILLLPRIILLGCVTITTSKAFVTNDSHKNNGFRYGYPLNVQFKTQYGKRPHGPSSIKRYGGSYVQELTRERCRMYKSGVLKDARMLFVRNVDVEITPDALDNFFHYIYGPLTSRTKLFKDRTTGRHMGFGYVTFSSPDIATRALLTLNGARLGDKQVYFTDVLYELAKKTKKPKDKAEDSAKRGVDDYRVPFLPLD